MNNWVQVAFYSFILFFVTLLIASFVLAKTNDDSKVENTLCQVEYLYKYDFEKYERSINTRMNALDDKLDEMKNLVTSLTPEKKLVKSRWNKLSESPAIIVPAIIAIIIFFVRECFNYYHVRYVYLANKWYDIIEHILENPIFDHSSRTRFFNSPLQGGFSGDDYDKYNSFARMLWGFTEDVYKHRFHRRIYKYTIIRAILYHKAWLDKNRGLFPSKFIKYIENYKL